MPQIFYYLLKVIVCSGILFLYYHLFLRNKIYHVYNRFYLLAAVVLSLTVPLLNFNINTNLVSKAQPIVLLEAVNISDEYLEETIIYSHRNNITSSEVMVWGYSLVSLVLLFILLKVVFHIYMMARKADKRFINDIIFITSNAKGTPFSFFKYLFWNNKIDINTETGAKVFAHELAHIKEKHSIDKMVINLVLVLFWINPVFWLIRKELNLIHEFIADKKAVGEYDPAVLAAMIIQTVYPRHNFLLANHFFYSPIKRRLKMLSKYKTTKAGYFARVLALPVILFIAAAFTLKAKQFNQPGAGRQITVVIDAGHGGTDPGAKGADGTVEKDINLILAQKIKALNTNDNIRILLTRETDLYMDPKEKAAFANKSGADLFISIHVASTPKENTELSGMEVFVAKDEFSNSTRSKLFASAIIASFKTNYGLEVKSNPLQRKTGINVLQQSQCPSILIEAGYISNKKDLAYLNTKSTQETFAKNILAAINNYINSPATSQVLELAKLNPEADASEGAMQRSNVQISNNSVIIAAGNTNLLNSGNPLYVIDGKLYQKDQLKSLKPDDIESVDVLKGQDAVSKYSERAKSGVVIITTKKREVTSDAGTASPAPPTFKPGTFYIGINNPLIINSNLYSLQDVTMQISQGQITGSNGRYYINVAWPGKVTINGYVNGKLISTHTFNVELISNPAPFIFFENKIMVPNGC